MYIFVHDPSQMFETLNTFLMNDNANIIILCYNCEFCILVIVLSRYTQFTQQIHNS